MLGGNAFVSPGERLTMAGQFRYAAVALRALEPLLAAKTPLVVSHGNGPQVGHMLVRVEQALGEAYALPLEVCVAESEGELGYVLQQTLYNLLHELGVSRPVVSLLTQVEVAADDEAFDHPDKPIGPAYDSERADELRRAGFAVREDPGRGHRRVVASPKPVAVVELDVIEKLLGLGVLVIAAGGGGVPVVRKGRRLSGVDAVIDKDRTAALIADAIDADRLIILSGVPCAYASFASAEQRPIGSVTRAELARLADEGHFPAGTMGPKVEAALSFTAAPGRTAIICDPPSLGGALTGQAGTIVRSEDIS